MSELEPDLTSCGTSARRVMTWQMRLSWLIILFIVQMLYVPINRTMHGGVVLSTPWDAFVPFWPIWAVPYLLSIVWWVDSFIWAAWKMEDRIYLAFVAGADLQQRPPAQCVPQRPYLYDHAHCVLLVAMAPSVALAVGDDRCYRDPVNLVHRSAQSGRSYRRYCVCLAGLSLRPVVGSKVAGRDVSYAHA
jgi:hypothetical protein